MRRREVGHQGIAWRPSNALADAVGHKRLDARLRSVFRTEHPDPSTVLDATLGGIRYRDQLRQQDLKTGADGKVTFSDKPPATVDQGKVTATGVGAKVDASGGTALSRTSDDGRLNFKKGETFSKIFKGIHDLELKYGDTGVFVRGKYWYDYELKDEDREFKPISDHNRKEGAKSSGAQILDAFVYHNYSLGDLPGTVRAGKQVVSWGESTFIGNSINSINPIDVSAFRRPGAEIKEGLIPVNMFYVSQSLTDNLSAVHRIFVFTDPGAETITLQNSGVNLQVLAGHDESRLTFLAVRRWYGWSAGRILNLDIGGGSLELIGVRGSKIRRGVTLPLGSLALQDSSHKSLKRAENIVRDAIADLPTIENGHSVEEMEYVSGPVRAGLNQLGPAVVPSRVGGHRSPPCTGGCLGAGQCLPSTPPPPM